MTAERDKVDGVVTLAAVGDIALCHYLGEQALASGVDWPFAHLASTFAKADLRFGNMESIVLPPDFPEDRIDPAGLVSKSDATEALKAAGFDFLNLATNHVLDGGTLGMFHTRDRIEALGITTGGVGQTQAEARQMKVLEARGLRFGFLCYAEDSNYTLSTNGPSHAWYDPETVLEDIATHRDKVDVLVVSVHADLENIETPSPKRRESFREFARAGARLVLGHHPHVPQGVELFEGSLLAYSLGNCYFFPHTRPWMKHKRPHTAHSFVLLADIAPDGVRSFSRVGFELREPPDLRPNVLEGPDAADLDAYFTELDRMCQDDDNVRSNWRRIALSRLETTLNALPKLDRTRNTWRGRVLRRLDRLFGRDDRVDIERVLDLYLARLLLVAENRNWVDEVLEEVRERWERQKACTDPHHRPQHQATRPKPDETG
jgi:capsule synthesis protein PGA_cap